MRINTPAILSSRPSEFHVDCD